MRGFFWLFGCFLLIGGTAHAEVKRFSFDKAHTSILFFVSHVGFSKMVGKFHEYDGYFDFDEQHPERSKVDITLNVSGIDTDHDRLNQVLRGKDFFNAERYPTLHFASRRIWKTGAKTGKAEGDLTMLGVTKPVTLNITFNRAGIHPLTQDYVAGFSADASLKRSEFGMTYGLPVLIGDEVKIHIETEGVNVLHKWRGEPLQKRKKK